MRWDEKAVDRLLTAWKYAFDAFETDTGPVLPEGQTLPDRRAIRVFLTRLPEEVIEDAMLKAAMRCRVSDSDAHRYFYGICWTLIRENQDE